MKIKKLNEQFEPVEETFDNSRFNISKQLTDVGEHIDDQLTKQGIDAQVVIDKEGVVWVRANTEEDIPQLVDKIVKQIQVEVDHNATIEKFGGFGFKFFYKSTKEVKRESFDENGEREYCQQCNTPLNDQGTCPKCDDGEEDILTEDATLNEVSIQDLTRAVNKRQAKADKHNAKQDNSAKKKGIRLVKRDFDDKFKDCKFILTSGSNKGKEYTWDQWRDAGSNIAEEDRYNAMVVDRRGYYVRRGAEDLLNQRVAYSRHDKVERRYRWDQSYDDATASDAPSEEPAAVSADAASGDDTTPPAEEPAAARKPRPRVPAVDASMLSDATVQRFAQLVRLTKLAVKNSSGEQLQAKAIAALKPEQLLDLRVPRGGKMVKFGDWYKSAHSLKLIEEMDDEELATLEEDVLTEAPVVQLSADDLMDPDRAPSISGIARQAAEKERAEQEAQAKAQRRAELMQKNKGLLDKVDAALSTSEQPSDALQVLFDELVPSEGVAETVAGEMTRAMMRILYRDYNDGDKFYEAYGLETCGSSANYLADEIAEASKHINMMLENSWKYDNDDEYTKAIEQLCSIVINHIISNPELLAEENSEDSREYDYSYIEENQPRYEYEWYASDDVVRLVDENILSAWDLHEYVESNMGDSYGSAFEGAEVGRPWAHDSTNGTINNLTKDGYEALEDMFRDNDRFWQDLFNDHKDQLSDDTEEDEDDEEGFEESINSDRSKEVDFSDIDDEDGWFDYQN